MFMFYGDWYQSAPCEDGAPSLRVKRLNDLVSGLSFTSLNFRGSCGFLSLDGSAEHLLLDSVCGVGINTRICPCMTSTRHRLVIFTSRRTAANKSSTSHHAELDAHMNTSTPRKSSETKKRECHLRDPAYCQKDMCVRFKKTHRTFRLEACGQRDSTLIGDIVVGQMQLFDGVVGLVMFHATAAAPIAARM